MQYQHFILNIKSYSVTKNDFEKKPKKNCVILFESTIVKMPKITKKLVIEKFIGPYAHKKRMKFQEN